MSDRFLSGIRNHERIHFFESESFRTSGKTLVGLRSWLGAIRQQPLTYVDSLSDEELATGALVPLRSREAMQYEKRPLIEVLRSIAIHESYHTGQLVSYLWARTDDPYQW